MSIVFVDECHDWRRRGERLSLFFDVTLFAAFVSVSRELNANVSPYGGAWTVSAFVMFWSIWSGVARFCTLFVSDDWLHRAMVLLQVFCVVMMAASVDGLYYILYDSERTEFFIFFAAARSVLIFLFLRALREIPGARRLCLRGVLIYGVGLPFWLAAGVVQPPWRLLAVAGALLVEVVLSLALRTRGVLHTSSASKKLLAARHSQLVHVVLCLPVFWVVEAESGTHAWLSEPVSIILIAAATIVASCLWWLYSDDVRESEIRDGAPWLWGWGLGHLVFSVSVLGVGIGLTKNSFFIDALGTVEDPYRYLLCIALAFAFCGLGIIGTTTTREESELSDGDRSRIRFVAAIFFLVLAPLAGIMAVWKFMLLVALACVLQVAIHVVLRA